MLPGALPLRVVIADDHAFVRRGIKTTLEERQGWVVCGEATNGQEAVDLVLDLRPDLVVLDISMPVVNGFQASKTIRHLLPEAKIIILSLHDSPSAQRAALKAGADAYIIKTSEPSKLFKAIESLGLK
jgi:DNA-binding NarL/FixJ family response regulator